jgi:N-acetylmuramoyl-L-alanine amidase
LGLLGFFARKRITPQTACRIIAVQQNAGVLGARKSFLGLLVLVGCANPPHRDITPVTDWQDERFAPLVIKPASSNSPRTQLAAKPSPAVARTPSPPHAQSLHETWLPLQRWSHTEGLDSPLQLSPPPQPSYSVHSSNGVFVLRPGTQLAQWDGTEVRLGFAPQLIDGQPYIHALDLKKTVQPLLAGPTPFYSNSHPVIVLDPGHGGENAGTKSVLGEHYEKEFTLDWALRLQKTLAASNCEVFLTRADDTDLALSNRVAFAAFHKADIFLSLHFNSAAPNLNEAGLETYCLTPTGMPSSLTRGFADEINVSFPNNAFDIQNLQLALGVHRALLQVNGHRDRGIRRARFPGVLRGQERPAILIEGGYLSNPEEARLIAEPGYRQKLAEAVASGVTQALGLSSRTLERSGEKANASGRPDSAERQVHEREQAEAPANIR